MGPVTSRICLLGRTAIERDGTPVATFAGRRSELVIAYLAVERHRTVSRDELADALWPDVLPDTWNAALRGVLSDIRRVLDRAGLDPSEVLLTEGGRVRLAVPDGTVVDVDEAELALTEARAALEGGDHAQAAELASRAGEALGEPFLPFHEDGWAAQVRSRLETLHIDALLLAGQAQLEAGDQHAALASSDRLVRADPFLEAGHRLRIESLGALGDRAGALKAYERCKSLLEAELGIVPSPETADALRQALQGAAPAQRSTTGGPAMTTAPTSPFAGYKVLVVEDHDFQRRTTLTLLRGLGVGTLDEAAGGADALDLLDRGPAPDVIVCDIDMPGMDGVEFIRHVAERGLASAVVIASGLEGRVLATVRGASQGYGLQVLGAVAKPLTTASLESMLAAYRPTAREDSTAADPATGSSVGELLRALHDGTLPVEFEPIVDLAVGRIAALRAHVRSPFADELPRAADAAGLGPALAECLLVQTSAAAQRLGVQAFVDVGPGLLTDVSLADRLSAITREGVVLVAGARALAAQDSPAMLDVLARLRIKGFGLCMEGITADGTRGYPLTHVALASELVVAAAATGDLAALQPAVDASRRLGVPMLGRCETGAEFELLLRVGCSLAHGRFMAGAIEPGELDAAGLEWTAPATADAR